MAEHTASVQWTRRGHPFTYDGYSRDHAVAFENGQTALASAAPDYLGNAEALNPETLLLGALVASSADAQAYQYQGMQLLAASDSAADLRAQRDAAALRANIFKAVAWGGGALCAAALVVMLGGAGILVAERLL